LRPRLYAAARSARFVQAQLGGVKYVGALKVYHQRSFTLVSATIAAWKKSRRRLAARKAIDFF
jgi:hypothetical protein